MVPIPMKNAAKCDKQCELQNSASHQIFERKWRWFIQHVYFSVPGIKHLNAIDACDQKLHLSLNRAGAENNLRSNEVVTYTISDLVGDKNGGSRIGVCKFKKKFHSTTPEIKQGHPLNLSISVSGGKETN